MFKMKKFKFEKKIKLKKFKNLTEKPKKTNKAQKRRKTTKTEEKQRNRFKNGEKCLPTVIWAGPETRVPCAES
jgi:hypothetical protein